MTNWITTKEIAELAECGITKSRQILRQVNQEVEDMGYIVPNKNKAPRDLVMKRLGLYGMEKPSQKGRPREVLPKGKEDIIA